MITIDMLYSNPKTFNLQREFTALLGGRFLGGVPDGRLYYTSEDKKDARLSPYEETVDTMLQMMEDSIASKRNLIIKQWPVWEDKPGRIY